MAKRLLCAALTVVALLLPSAAVGTTPADQGAPAAVETPCPQPARADPQVLQLAKRGCCSHHGGVCGCSNGRAVCCDRTYSPTCGCRADGGTAPTP
ncbi:MAG: hypothetical protein H0S85_13585 [Desulfovibrionaceae bacterium]|jgi:hypothetical protein|nr:hypothetical protein [Desulfovibrionaceae bacterium]